MATTTPTKCPVYAEIPPETHEPDPVFVQKSDIFVRWCYGCTGVAICGFLWWGASLFGFFQTPNQRLVSENAELSAELANQQDQLAQQVNTIEGVKQLVCGQ